MKMCKRLSSFVCNMLCAFVAGKWMHDNAEMKYLYVLHTQK